MSELIINMSGLGKFTMTLDIIDPSNPDDLDQVEVWRASFCDESNNDCELVYFEMPADYEVWDLINQATAAYQREFSDD